MSKRQASVSSRPKSRKHFELVSPVSIPRKSSMNVPSFDAAFDREASGSLRRSERDLGAPPIFAFAKRK